MSLLCCKFVQFAGRYEGRVISEEELIIQLSKRKTIGDVFVSVELKKKHNLTIVVLRTSVIYHSTW